MSPAVVAIIGLSVCGVGVACCLYMLARNERVYRFRLRMIDTDWAGFHRLPSYEAMLYRWWVWPLDSFLPSSAKPASDDASGTNP